MLSPTSDQEGDSENARKHKFVHKYIQIRKLFVARAQSRNSGKMVNAKTKIYDDHTTVEQEILFNDEEL